MSGQLLGVNAVWVPGGGPPLLPHISPSATHPPACLVLCGCWLQVWTFILSDATFKLTPTQVGAACLPVLPACKDSSTSLLLPFLQRTSLLGGRGSRAAHANRGDSLRLQFELPLRELLARAEPALPLPALPCAAVCRRARGGMSRRCVQTESRLWWLTRSWHRRRSSEALPPPCSSRAAHGSAACLTLASWPAASRRPEACRRSVAGSTASGLASRLPPTTCLVSSLPFRFPLPRLLFRPFVLFLTQFATRCCETSSPSQRKGRRERERGSSSKEESKGAQQEGVQPARQGADCSNERSSQVTKSAQQKVGSAWYQRGN